MVAFNTPHPVRAYTRRTYGKNHLPSIRGVNHIKTRRKTHFPGKSTVLPQETIANFENKLVKMNNKEERLTKRVKRAANMNAERQSRINKKMRRKAKEWKAIVKVINDPEITENIGIYIRNRKLVSNEGEILPEQFKSLIEELQGRLGSSFDAYEERILNKAIAFVENFRDTYTYKEENSNDMSSLLGKMSLS